MLTNLMHVRYMMFQQYIEFNSLSLAKFLNPIKLLYRLHLNNIRNISNTEQYVTP